jgi:3-hydroxyisobutyrate dehydrogenase-like beta-hydroxyacid dehydrogenase
VWLEQSVVGDIQEIVQSMKDFTIIRECAREAGQALPFAALYIEMLQGCIQAGEGDWDNCAIIEEIRRRILPRDEKHGSSGKADSM